MKRREIQKPLKGRGRSTILATEQGVGKVDQVAR